MTATYYPPERVEQAVKLVLDQAAEARAAAADSTALVARCDLQAALGEPFVRWMMAQENAGAAAHSILASVASIQAWLVAVAAGTLADGDKRATAVLAAQVVNAIGLSVGEVITAAGSTTIRPVTRN